MREITDQEIIDSHLATGNLLDPDQFPQLGTLSSAHFYQLMPVARNPAPPEIVFLPTHNSRRVEIVGLLATWNHLWESAQYRKGVFKSDKFEGSLPALMQSVDRLPSANIYLVPETKSSYDAYCPLYSLLLKSVLDRHGIPALKRPLWPSNSASPRIEDVLPADFQTRLGRAFAEHVWHYLDSGSGLRAFSASDSLKLLSHNLDFWLPYALTVIEDRMRELSRVEPETSEQVRLLAGVYKIPRASVVGLFGP